ncbi:MAG: hydrogenase formation protein HypD [Tannerellaceae bacterium]|jgi:hydrogenase expression/formation protein HypD|nr:hydrogenase formation protein HypD [Tannerellaceae bacterium]
MKYLNEYRNKERAEILIEAIRRQVTRPWHIMEVCGGQTHAIARYRLEELLPQEITLLHGPGCPVCVTPEATIDYALELAMQPDVIFTSFGDMMRVPGSREDLLRIKARGADIRMLYSPLDAVEIAASHPDKRVVFFAIGFETTAPVHLAAVKEAHRRQLSNFYLLLSLFTVPAVIEAILSEPICRIDGFLLAGHVCAIAGYRDYQPIATKYHTPMVVTGFEPVDLLYGIYRCITQLETSACSVENAYKRVVTEDGNRQARALIDEMFEPCDQEWRGIGIIPKSGFRMKHSEWEINPANHSSKRDERNNGDKRVSSDCIAGSIMRGLKQVTDCPHFCTDCTPLHPIGAPMVSPEGVCAAYYNFK